MTQALPASKPQTGARFVISTAGPADVADPFKSSLKDEPKEEGISFDAWRLIGLAAGGASIPLIIEIFARLFGHRPF